MFNTAFLNRRNKKMSETLPESTIEEQQPTEVVEEQQPTEVE